MQVERSGRWCWPTKPEDWTPELVLAYQMERIADALEVLLLNLARPGSPVTEQGPVVSTQHGGA